MANINLQTSKKIPIWIKIISIFYFISAAFILLMGVIMLFVSAIVSGVISKALPEAIEGAIAGGSFVILLGIIMICIAIVMIFVGIWLWKIKKWARITAIILSVLFAAPLIKSAITGDIMSIFFLIIHLGIGSYLIFNKKVKQIFS